MYSKIDWKSDNYYNYEDFNRVLSNINLINDLLIEFKNISVLENKNNMVSMKAILYAEVLNKTENQIEKLGESAFKNIKVNTKVDWKSNESISFEDINRIEKNLQILYEYYQYNIYSIKKCGMVKAGVNML